jgi:hypothetical protein
MMTRMTPHVDFVRIAMHIQLTKRDGGRRAPLCSARA